jgi:hypothetical protein
MVQLGQISQSGTMSGTQLDQILVDAGTQTRSFGFWWTSTYNISFATEEWTGALFWQLKL